MEVRARSWVSMFYIAAICALAVSVLASGGAAAAQAADTGGGAMLCGTCMFYGLIFVVIIAVAIWVYRDANRRGMNGTLWLIVVLLGSIIGLIVYLVVRNDSPPAFTETEDTFSAHKHAARGHEAHRPPPPPKPRRQDARYVSAPEQQRRGVKEAPTREYQNKDEICPSCRYHFTSYAAVERGARSAELTCPNCGFVFIKKLGGASRRK